MNFREFLMTSGSDDLAELLVSKDYQMINTFSKKFRDILRRYYFVGGMPEAVQSYIDNDNMEEVRTIQKQLLLYYENDFSKHAPKEQIPRIQMVWNSISSQLSKKNRKFIYGVIREGAHSKDFETAIKCTTIYDRRLFENFMINLMTNNQHC